MTLDVSWVCAGLDVREAETQPFAQEERDLCPANVGVRRLLAPEQQRKHDLGVCVCVWGVWCSKGTGPEGKPGGSVLATGIFSPRQSTPQDKPVCTMWAP